MFDCVQDTKWCRLSFDDICDFSGIDKIQAYQFASTKSDILGLYSRQVTCQIFKNLGPADPQMPAKDRLFDVFMERFDIMNEQREPLVAIIKSLDIDPVEALSNGLNLNKTITSMIQAAGLSTSGIRGQLRLKAVCVIYLLTLKTWLEDDSDDLSATMVKLDKLLKRAEQLAKTFRLDQQNMDVI